MYIVDASMAAVTFFDELVLGRDVSLFASFEMQTPTAMCPGAVWGVVNDKNKTNEVHLTTNKQILRIIMPNNYCY